MNSLVQTALNKLIQDETFRSELASMLDEVNRSADTLVSREQTADPEPDKAREEDEPSTTNFTDIKEDLLSDTAFLKALVSALMDASTPDEERATRDADMLEKVERLSSTVQELSATINEHDKVLTDLAEKTIVQEGKAPVLLRARSENTKDENKTENASKLEARAARVLTRMGGE